MLGKALIAGIISLAVIGTAVETFFPPRPVVLYNPSASAPIGWYRLRDKISLKNGEQIAVYAPEWARRLADKRGYLPYDYPLIKTIWAISGEQVCYHENRVIVPNRPDISRQKQDSLGRDMPVRSGCIILKSGEYLAISPDVQAGFDSRYFGPVGLENILGRVEYLGKRKSEKMPKNAGLERFEG